MYLMDNAYNSGAALNGKCRAFATGGGCRICNDLFYIHEKTHLAREGKCKTDRTERRARHAATRTS